MSETCISSKSEAHTIKIAQDFAKTLSKNHIICLNGDLGMGKSVFARALIRALCHDKDMDVPSPTFTLVQSYEAQKNPIWHFDLYRLNDPEEIYEIGWEDALSTGICIIEWPERMGALLPDERTEITLSSVKDRPDMRNITIKLYSQSA